MKKNLLFLLFAIMVFAAAVSAQEPRQNSTMSPEKRALIAEVLAVTKADQQVEATIKAISAQLDSQYPEMIQAVVEKTYPKLSDVDRQKMVDILTKRNSGEQRFRDRLFGSLDYKDYVEKTIYPLYDKFFTESEIADLLTFYKSPTGQKVNHVMPELFAESVRLAQNILIPKVMELSNRTVEADVAKAHELISAKPVKN